MAFSTGVKEEALVRSRRSCCICHEFAGLYTNVHHIKQEAEGGENKLENAIVLCLRCHGEAGHYNLKHPIGDKYKPSELIRHRDSWWDWCSRNPDNPLPADPIVLSPYVISGRTNRVQTSIKLYNKTDVPLYQIRVRIDLGGRAGNNIKIEPLNLKGELEASLGDISINADLIRNDVALDDSGNEVIYLYISSIDPKETFTLRFIEERKTDSVDSDISLGLTDYSDVPCVPQYLGGGKYAYPFQVDDQCKLLRTSVLMKKAY